MAMIGGPVTVAHSAAGIEGYVASVGLIDIYLVNNIYYNLKVYL